MSRINFVVQGQFRVGSYQVGTLKGGLYNRPHIAPLPITLIRALDEPYMGVPTCKLPT